MSNSPEGGRRLYDPVKGEPKAQKIEGDYNTGAFKGCAESSEPHTPQQKSTKSYTKKGGDCPNE